MSAFPMVDPATAPAETAAMLQGVQASLGVVPNMTRAMATSPALLKGYLELSKALGGGRLRPAVREQIALAVAQANSCDYCLSAHGYLAEHVSHLDAEAITAARAGDAQDPRTAAVLRLAVEVNDGRGSISADALETTRAAGVSDEEIAEIVGQVALNVLTNYFNKVADVEIDFPVVTA